MMLSKIEISNFKSIVHTELGLSCADKKAPNGYKDSEELFFLEPTKKLKDRISPLMCLYGSNASGKSNIIKSIFVLLVIIRNGLKDIRLDKFKPFHNRLNNVEDYSKLEIEFFYKSKNYIYTLKFNSENICNEKLICNDVILFEIINSRLTNATIQTEVNDKEFLERLLFESLNGNNQVNTFLTTVYRRLPNLNADVSDAAKFIRNKLMILSDTNLSPSYAIAYLANSKDEDKLEDALAKISNVIQKLDIDIDSFKFNHRESNLNADDRMHLSTNYQNPDLYEIITIHKDNQGNKVRFKLREESLGTQLLFAIIGIMIKTLEDGNIMFLDEIDKSLHPTLTRTILEIFKSKKYNRYGSQLISTLHTTDVLEFGFRTSDFAFITKSDKYGTKVKRLSDFENRQDINFRDRYIAGLYKSNPNVQI